MCFTDFPALGSSVFNHLNPGDEIRIAAGHGNPQTEDDVIEIIADVNNFSALTNMGRLLACFDASGIDPTGNRFDEYEMSPKAQKILGTVYGTKGLVNG